MATTSPDPGSSGTIDLGRAFTFVREDPDVVKKFVIGSVFGLLAFVFVGIFFLAGYQLRMIRRVARGERRPLPEWDDFGGLFVDGLKVFGLNLAHGLALILVLGCPFAVVVLAMSAAGSSRNSGAEALGVLSVLAFYGVVGLASLILAVYLPAALARLAALDSFGAAFDVKENISFIRRNLANYALSLVLYVIGYFASQLGILLCCIGLLPAAFWALTLFAWGLGETIRRDATLSPPPPFPTY